MKQNKFAKKDLEHLATLAKLNISESEEGKYVSQLGEILEYVGRLNELDLKNVKETNQVTGLSNVTVEDKSEEGLDREEVLSQAPQTHDGYVLVEAIFGESDE